MTWPYIVPISQLSPWGEWEEIGDRKEKNRSHANTESFHAETMPLSYINPSLKTNNCIFKLMTYFSSGDSNSCVHVTVIVNSLFSRTPCLPAYKESICCFFPSRAPCAMTSVWYSAVEYAPCVSCHVSWTTWEWISDSVTYFTCRWLK